MPNLPNHLPAKPIPIEELLEREDDFALDEMARRLRLLAERHRPSWKEDPWHNSKGERVATPFPFATCVACKVIWPCPDAEILRGRVR